MTTEAEIELFVRSQLEHCSGTAEQLFEAVTNRFNLTDFKLNLQNIPTWQRHIRLQSRVVARVVAACLTRPIVTLTDLEAEIAASEGNVGSFAELGLGPSLQCLPVAQRYFGLKPRAPPVRPTTAEEILRFYTASAGSSRILMLSSYDLASGFAAFVGQRRAWDCGIHIQDLPQFRLVLQTEAARFPPSNGISLLQSFARASRSVIAASAPAATARTVTTAAASAFRPRIGNQTKNSIAAATDVTPAALIAPSGLKICGFGDDDDDDDGNGEKEKQRVDGQLTAPVLPPAPRQEQQQVPQRQQHNSPERNRWNGADFFSVVFGSTEVNGIDLSREIIIRGPTINNMGSARPDVNWTLWNSLCFDEYEPRAVRQLVFEAFLLWYASQRLGAAAAAASRKEREDQQLQLPQVQENTGTCDNNTNKKDRPRYRPPGSNADVASSALAAPMMALVEAAVKSLDDELGVPSSIVCVDPASATTTRMLHLPTNSARNGSNASPEHAVVFYCYSETQRRSFQRKLEVATQGEQAQQQQQQELAAIIASRFPIVVLFSPIRYLTQSMEDALSHPIHLSSSSSVQFLPISCCFTTDFKTVSVDKQQEQALLPAMTMQLTACLSLSLEALRIFMKQKCSSDRSVQQQQQQQQLFNADFFDTLDAAFTEAISPWLQLIAVSDISISHNCSLPAGSADSKHSLQPVCESRNSWFDEPSCTLFVAPFVGNNTVLMAMRQKKKPKAIGVVSASEMDSNRGNVSVRGNIVADVLADGIIDLVRKHPFTERFLLLMGAAAGAQQQQQQQQQQKHFSTLRALAALRPLLVDHFTWSLFLDPNVMNFECRARGLLGGCNNSSAGDSSSNFSSSSWRLQNAAVALSGKVAPHYPITAGGRSVPLIPELEKTLPKFSEVIHASSGSSGSGGGGGGIHRDSLSFHAPPRQQQQQQQQQQHKFPSAQPQQSEKRDERRRNRDSYSDNDDDDDDDDDDGDHGDDCDTSSNPFLQSMNAALSNPKVARAMQQKSSHQQYGNKKDKYAHQQKQQASANAEFVFQSAGSTGNGVLDFDRERAIQSRAAEEAAYHYLCSFVTHADDYPHQHMQRIPFWQTSSSSSQQQQQQLSFARRGSNSSSIPASCYRLVAVDWVNQNGEQGLPYDLVETYRVALYSTADYQTHHHEEKHYVDVKSTSLSASASAALDCHLSVRELIFASARPEQYHIIHVANLAPLVQAIKERDGTINSNNSSNKGKSKVPESGGGGGGGDWQQALQQCTIRRVQAPLLQWSGNALSSRGSSVRIEGEITMRVANQQAVISLQ